MENPAGGNFAAWQGSGRFLLDSFGKLPHARDKMAESEDVGLASSRVLALSEDGIVCEEAILWWPQLAHLKSIGGAASFFLLPTCFASRCPTTSRAGC